MSLTKNPKLWSLDVIQLTARALNVYYILQWRWKVGTRGARAPPPPKLLSDVINCIRKIEIL